MSVDVSTVTREDVLAAQAIVAMLAGTEVVVEESVKALAELDPMKVAPKVDGDATESKAAGPVVMSRLGELYHVYGIHHDEPDAVVRASTAGDVATVMGSTRSLMDLSGSPFAQVAEMNRETFAAVAETNRDAVRSYRRVVEGVFAGDGSMASSFVAGLTPKDKALLRASLDASE